MAENPFVKSDSWKPPDKAENPYRAATVKHQVVYVKPAEIPFSTADFAPKYNGNPYVSAEAYQALSGVRLTSANATNSPSPYANAKKITITIGESEINRKFTIGRDGIYLRPKNRRPDAPV